jgi:hypothetical protein
MDAATTTKLFTFLLLITSLDAAVACGQEDARGNRNLSSLPGGVMDQGRWLIDRITSPFAPSIRRVASGIFHRLSKIGTGRNQVSSGNLEQVPTFLVPAMDQPVDGDERQNDSGEEPAIEEPIIEVPVAPPLPLNYRFA